MRSEWWRRVVALACVLMYGSQAQSDILLVEQGEPRTVIVVGSHPSDQAREAAAVLQDYIARISGARLEIRDEATAPKGPRIFVGQSQAVRNLGVDDMSKRTHAMNEERVTIKTVGDDLVLVGNEHPFYRGTAYAVYELLERLGCRWFFPGAYGEVVPKRATIVVEAINLDERPDFRFRNIWYDGYQPVTPQDAAEFAVWADRNKMNTLKGVNLPLDGTADDLVPPAKYFADHPEYYAIDKKGQRDKEMLCVTEPEVTPLAVGTIRDAFRANPEQSTFGFAPADGAPMCYCKRCLAANPQFAGKGYGEPSFSDVWFPFANTLAQEIYKEFPDRWVLTNGYSNRVRPPEGVGPLSPNLGVMLASIRTCTFHSIGDPKCWQRQLYKTVLDRWTRDLRCVFIYDYGPGKALDGLPFPMLHSLMRDFPYFKQRGVWGFCTEGQNCWMVTHLNYYVRAKLMWNAKVDVRGLVRDYCQRFYGPAAKAAEDYIWALDDAVDRTAIHETFGQMVPWRVVYTPKDLRRMDGLMARARKQAASEPYSQRVQVLEGVHNYVRGHIGMEEAAAEGDFDGAVKHADEMLRIRDQIGQVDDSLIPVTSKERVNAYGAMELQRKTAQELADRMNGTRGSLVAMTPRVWEFRRDPEDVGVLEEWYVPTAPGRWDKIDSTLYWEAQGFQDAQGHGMAGKAWYRSTFAVPASAADRPLTLTFGGLNGSRLWIWINGQYAGHRFNFNTKLPTDLDVTNHIKPGQINHVALLFERLADDKNNRGGLHRRVLLWTPTQNSISQALPGADVCPARSAATSLSGTVPGAVIR